MIKAIHLLMVTMLLLPAGSPAKWKDRQGNILPDTDAMKSEGDFGAQLLLIDDEKRFFKRWNTPSKVVDVDTVSEIPRGAPLITPVIFSGCSANESGNCMVSGDFKVLRPNGSSYADLPDVEIWQNKPPPVNGMLELGMGFAKIVIEPDDPDGTYEVVATVTDHVSETSLRLTTTFSVTAEETAEATDQAADEKPHRLSQWLTYYYKNPHTDQDIEKIKEIFEIGMFTTANSGPLVMFLAEFFRQNEKRLALWEKRLHQIPQQDDYYLLHALWQANLPATLNIVEQWPDKNALQAVESYMKEPPIQLGTIDIDSPATLDMLWASFFASGSRDYVERIISVLDRPTEGGDKQTRLNNILLVGAAKWSLSSNAVQHEQVFDICQGFTQSDNLAIRQSITEVLAQAKKIEAQQKQ
jgi:hypothetical protein